MMKLLYITNGINGAGGLERVLSIKASYLADNFNYEVHILTLNNSYQSPFYKFSSNIKFHDIKVEGNFSNYFFQYKRGIKKIIKKTHPNVISVCDDGLKGVLFPLFFRNRIPVIYERHASVNLNFSRDYKTPFVKKAQFYFEHKLMVFGAKKFDAFVVLTKGNKKDWPNVECIIIPNLSPFKVVEKLVKKEEKVVLAVGSQSYNKGYDRLIKIWNIVHKKHPDWKLKIFGKITKNLNLQQEIDLLGLNKIILLHKPVQNIEDQYKEASIYVMPSRSEGFGMVLIEAMSFGVPCISFDCPHGPADIIKDDEDGFLIENGNIQEFAASIIRLIDDKELRNRFGIKATENVKRFAPEIIVPIWDVLFKSLVK
ncbi:glycosyltransferase family 4 protein [Lutibacter sp.]|uniref:glycosyltransferase family 4 protein n=1 Tax=Lutibacter sp. TaxID=1925666 RepID=UPI0025C23D5C|nr:glycosyltransferase family 4 protein [Lutibacter sp.]MCF6168482.1 glycosyltransferase family 4 protein [Lutibacter sp.]